MLSVQKISKTYGRGKLAVTALNDISIDFPETGMVMILGKSGCGKSTLLNILGGLDRPTSGDVFINGVPFSALSSRKLDDYRNTYVGFVFQNFNIIENRTVYENIEIALKLQNHRSDFESIDEALSAVGLAGLGYRKPSELSGGQRQRVAIARALVKQPEIILADEPSGSLDSVTGEDLFVALKKISNSKLVIVVTHDNEIAYKYGDRIIFLKDGVITGDIDRIKHETDADTKFIRDNIMFVKAGHRLSAEEAESTLRSDADNYLTFETDKQHVVLAYPDTIEEVDEGYSPGDFSAHQPYEQKETPPLKLRRASMSFKNCLAQAAANLKKRKIRFITTFIVSVICLSLLSTGITLTMITPQSIISNTTRDAKLDFLTVETTYMNPDANKIKEAFTEFSPGLFYSAELEYIPVNNTKVPSDNEMDDFINTLLQRNQKFGISGLIEYDDIEQSGLKLLCGEFPKNKSEILITDVTADELKTCGFVSVDENGSHELYIPVSYDEIPGKTLFLGAGSNHCKLRISGVIKTNCQYILDNSKDISLNNLLDLTTLTKSVKDEYKVAFTVKGTAEELENVLSKSGVADVNFFFDDNSPETSYFNYYNDDLTIGSTLDGADYIFTEPSFAARNCVLNDDEIVVSYDVCREIVQLYMDTYPDIDPSSMSIFDLANFEIPKIYVGIYYNRPWRYTNYTDDDYEQMYKYNSNTNPFKIVGVTTGNKSVVFSENVAYSILGSTLYPEKIYLKADAVNAKKVVSTARAQELDISSLKFTEVIDIVDRLHTFGKVLFVFSLMTGFLLYIIVLNFITLLIKERNKELGIMRALGSSGPVTIKVFYIELGFLDIITVIASAIVTANIVSTINGFMGLIMLNSMTFVKYGPLQILIAFALFTLFLAVTAFPFLLRIVRKQPIDVIRSI